MQYKNKKRILILFSTILISNIFYLTHAESKMHKEHVILLGASVGSAWKIEEFPKRINNQDYFFEYIGVYNFDKTSAILDIIARREAKPDILIIKECAAYFPGNLSHYKELIAQWVNICHENKIIPILATVVPIAKPGLVQTSKDIIKRLTSKGTCAEERQKAIESYNDWIREFARLENLVILDMEKALRVSLLDRHLDDNLDSGDGLHLNNKAYQILDQLLIPALQKVEHSFK